MVSEVRFNRLEDKVDKVDEKLDTVDKTTLEIQGQLDKHISTVEQHITGDEKIINYLEPLIPHLQSIAEMAKDHQFQKMKKIEKSIIIKDYSTKLKIWGGSVALLTATLTLLAKLTNLF
jgi:hypothetical protein